MTEELQQAIEDVAQSARERFGSVAEVRLIPPSAEWRTARLEIAPHDPLASPIRVWEDNDLIAVWAGRSRGPYEVTATTKAAAVAQVNQLIDQFVEGHLIERYLGPFCIYSQVRPPRRRRPFFVREVKYGSYW